MSEKKCKADKLSTKVKTAVFDKFFDQLKLLDVEILKQTKKAH